MEANFARTLSDGQSGAPALMGAIETFLADAAVPPDVTAKMLLAFDEIISNDLLHGAKGRVPTIEISIQLSDGLASAMVIDDGQAFDPLAAPTPDTSLSAEERPIGGLGILLVRELMDEVTYRREEGHNWLLFSKDFPIANKGKDGDTRGAG